MIIVCTACEKKFSVPDSAISASGRLVQCSSCGNKWTQYPIKTKKIVEKKVSEVLKKPAKKIQKRNQVQYLIQKNICNKNGGPHFKRMFLQKALQ